MSKRLIHPHRRRAITAVFVAISLPLIMGFAALTIDVGYLYIAKADLQDTADAIVLAAANQLPDEAAALAVAQEIALLNDSAGLVLMNADLRLGNWDAGSATFAEGALPMNAAQAITRRSQSNGNAINMFFSAILGQGDRDVWATAIGLSGTPAPSDVPMALRRPGFGDVDPASPFKPGPSMPANGQYFEVGEEVIMGFTGVGIKPGIAITLDITIAPGDAALNDIITGDAELSGENIPLVDVDTTVLAADPQGRFVKRLDNRLLYADSHFLRDIVVPVVDLLPNSRDPVTGKLTGDVEVVDSVAVHVTEYRQFIAVDPVTGDTTLVEALFGLVTGITNEFAPFGTDLGAVDLTGQPAQLVQ